MIQSSPQSSTIDLDATFKNAAGALVDPVLPLVTIIRPDATVALSAGAPLRLTTGVFRYSFSIPAGASKGIWSALWSGSIEGTPLNFEDVFEVTAIGTPPEPSRSQIDRGAQGAILQLDAIFRVGNVRTDPTTPHVTIRDPQENTIVAAASPTRLSQGVFRYTLVVPYDAITGFWNVTWTGNVNSVLVSFVDAFEVTPDAPLKADYSSGIERVQSGYLFAFDGIFRTVDGALFNPSAVRVQIYDPSGTEVLDESPPEVTTGVFRYLYSASDEGFWTIKWTGDSLTLFDAFQAVDDGEVAYDSSHAFGASLRAVRSIATNTRIATDSKPSNVDVEGFIDMVGDDVSLRLGDLTVIPDIKLFDRINRRARDLINLGAAAMAIDAAFPAGVDPNKTNYSQRLREQFDSGLEALLVIVNSATPGDDPATGDISAPLAEAPPPQFSSYMRF